MRRERLNHWLEHRHPNLVIEGYQVDSRRNKKYNCVAYAVGDCKWWWEPAVGPGLKWPRKVPKVDVIESYIKLFEGKGYELCDDGSLIPDYEKVVLYQDEDGQFMHVAKQAEDGYWLSKLGQFEDIIHKTPGGLKDDAYGTPTIYLRRKITRWIKIQKRMMSVWCRWET